MVSNAPVKVYASGIVEVNPQMAWGPCVTCGTVLRGEDSCGRSPCCDKKGEAGTVFCPTCQAWNHYRGGKWLLDPINAEAVYRID